MIDHTFCNSLLREMMKEVKSAGVTKEQIKHSWAWRRGNDGEFHGPNGFFFNCRAHCLADAKYKGWNAYIAKTYPDFEPKERE